VFGPGRNHQRTLLQNHVWQHKKHLSDIRLDSSSWLPLGNKILPSNHLRVKQLNLCQENRNKSQQDRDHSHRLRSFVYSPNNALRDKVEAYRFLGDSNDRQDKHHLEQGPWADCFLHHTNNNSPEHSPHRNLYCYHRYNAFQGGKEWEQMNLVGSKSQRGNYS